MNKVLYHKLLKIELLVIIVLLLAILGVSVWNDYKRRKVPQKPPLNQQSGLLAPESSEGYMEFGFASYYGNEFHGNPTASGELYDRNALTAAHRELPFGTQVRVLNMETGDHVVVRINDRGPHDEERILDVSEKAAKKLGLFDTGVARVRVEVLE